MNGTRKPIFMMTPPTHFKVAYRINPHMEPDKWQEKFNKQARKQWDVLFDTIHDLGVHIRLQWPEPGFPDMCFTANHGFILDRKALVCRFRFGQRCGEETFADRSLALMKHVGLIDNIFQLEGNEFFEGQGDCLACNNVIYYGRGLRSEPRPYRFNDIWTEYQSWPVTLVDPRFYHLDTCFLPLSKGTLFYYPPAIQNPTKRVMDFDFDRYVVLTEREAMGFAANSIEIGDNLITPFKGKRFFKMVERAGYNPIYVNMSAFQKAGGAAACLILRV